MADTARSAAALKAFFETGDIPTQQQFADFITSYSNLVDNNLLDGIDAGVTTVTPPVQGTATALTKRMNLITVNAADDGGVKLPTGANNMLIGIVNTAAGTVSIFPTTGQNINQLAANARITIGASGYVVLQYITSVGWSIVGGTIFSTGTVAMPVAENEYNKATSTSLGTSNVLYPTQNAVKTYVDARTTGTVKRYTARVFLDTGSIDDVTVICNTTGMTPAWTYSATGILNVTLPGAWDYTKMMFYVTAGQALNLPALFINDEDAPSPIHIEIKDLAGSAVSSGVVWFDVLYFGA